MANKVEFTYASRDGINKVHAIKWIPEEKPVKAIVQIVHGMIEYIDRYEAFANYLCDNGIMVVGNDHLGHGKTAKTQDDFGYFAEKDGSTILVRDVHRLKKIVEEENPGIPYFILGFSMGSYILRKYLTWYGKGIRGAIIAGSGQPDNSQINRGLRAIKLVKSLRGDRFRSKFLEKQCFGKYNSKITSPKTSHDWLCTDENVVRDYENDEFCNYLFTCEGYEELLKMIKYDGEIEHVKSVPEELPILIISGSEDPVSEYGVKVKTIYDLYLRSGLKYVTYNIYEGMRHEIFNEKDKEKVWKDVLNWVLANCL
ncbi:MAG: alpha/beta fold hydrolase [Lachnospiraceae bacterium]|nr:alpha/beta fold hydrolase [Lachnospiraceae bacterium]MEE0959668.1 alpha/beta fold hydrolase [Lachnospiraceae bacterium]